MVMKKISLCMIVKNEAAYLAECLESARAAVDEMIVVDTGSIDATMDIAARHGAKVHHFPWCGDFSAARNESLRHAEGQWLLVLDADERLTDVGCRKIRQLVASDAFDVFLLQTRSPHGSSAWAQRIATGLSTRLFRSRPDLRFTGRLHETLDRSRARPDTRVAASNVTIAHLGYEKDVQEKHVRNYKITDAEERPEQFIRFDLIRRDMATRDYHGALARANREAADPTLPEWLKAQVYLMIGDALAAHGEDRAGVTRSYRTASAIDAHLVAPRLRIASIQHHRHEHERALAEFRRIIALLQLGPLRGVRLDDEIPLSAAHLCAASCCMKLGLRDEAMDHLSWAKQSEAEQEEARTTAFEWQV
jgi:glycosyltransferase involved in cell wall biosynthesis